MHEVPVNSPAHANPAVSRCCSAWGQAFQQARSQGKGEVYSGIDAAQAFRRNLPALDSVDAVRDFIACVAQGMLLGAITGPDGARLLYAAQVTNTTLRGHTTKPSRAA